MLYSVHLSHIVHQRDLYCAILALAVPLSNWGGVCAGFSARRYSRSDDWIPSRTAIGEADDPGCHGQAQLSGRRKRVKQRNAQVDA